MSEWKEYKLKEMLSSKGYIRGPFGSSLRRGEMRNEGIPVYEQQHAIYNHRDFRFFIDDEKFIEMKRFQVCENDLIISCSGTVGKVSIIKEYDKKGIISQALLLLRPNTEKIFPEYLLYFFKTSNGFNQLINASHGSVQQNIATREVVENIPINIPDKKTQEEILSILFSLDDKIDLLHRQNKTLEQLAETLFRQWFVEEAEESWEVRKLSDLAIKIQYGFTQSASSENIGPKFLRITDIQGGHLNWDIVPYCFANDEEFSKYELKTGDIVVARTGASTGENLYIYNPEKAIFASYLIRIQFSKPSLARYVSLHMRSSNYFRYIEGILSGSAQPNANANELTSFEVSLPPAEKIESFFTIVNEFDMKSHFNNIQIRSLTKLRDTLLPKLMSGDIRVEME